MKPSPELANALRWFAENIAGSLELEMAVLTIARHLGWDEDSPDKEG